VYSILKHIHVSCVGLSAAGFLLRGLWMLRGSPLLGHRLTRVVPHVVDAVLLASALALSVLLGQYPFRDDWLTAKLSGLLVYIGLGTVALKRGRTRLVRLTAWLAALAVLAYIASVAVTKQPAGLFALI
jgi:uncharacterized membrane protein SirB2